MSGKEVWKLGVMKLQGDGHMGYHIHFTHISSHELVSYTHWGVEIRLGTPGVACVTHTYTIGSDTDTHCNTRQHTAIYCNRL